VSMARKNARALTVVVTGVCALVSDDAGSWTAVMPQAREATLGRNTDRGNSSIIPIHRPYLSVEMGSNVVFTKASRTPDLRFRSGDNLKGGPETAVFFLDDERLTIQADMTGVDQTSEQDSIVRLGAVCGSANRPTINNPDQVTARVQIGPGILQAGRLTPGYWTFEPPREGTDTVLSPRRWAQEVLLVYRLDGDVVSLESANPAKGPIRMQAEGDLRIEIGNASVEDIIKVGQHHHDTIDPHFELFYRLIGDHDGQLHIPHLAVAPSAIRPMSQLGSDCMPGTLP